MRAAKQGKLLDSGLWKYTRQPKAQSKPSYREYMATTSAFAPWKKRRL